MSVFFAPTQRCPRCGYTTDRFGDLDEGRAPQAGDYIVCINCAGVNVLTPERRLRPMTREEHTALPLNEKAGINDIVRRIIAVNRIAGN